MAIRRSAADIRAIGGVAEGGGAVSVQAMTWVMNHSDARLGDRLVLFSIANHADSYGRAAWPSIATIAAEARLSERQVKRALPRLIELGELDVDEGGGPNGVHRFSIRMGDNLAPPKTSRGDILAKGGDKSCTKSGQDVTQTVLEPSKEPSKTRARKESGALRAVARPRRVTLLSAAERKARWQSKMMQEAQATMAPKAFGELVAALMAEPLPKWAKVELERLDQQIKRRKQAA